MDVLGKALISERTYPFGHRTPSLWPTFSAAYHKPYARQVQLTKVTQERLTTDMLVPHPCFLEIFKAREAILPVFDSHTRP